MPTKVLGQQGAIEQPKSYSGGPFKPDTTTRKWRGPKAAILSMIPQVRGYEWSVDIDGPNATLTAQVPNLDTQQEVPVESWELLPGAVEKDFLESDIALCENILSDEAHPDKQAIRDGIENRQKKPPAFKGTGINLAAAQAAYDLMLGGVRATKVFAPTLKHTYVVSNVYAVRFANTNVKRIISTATLLTIESVPGSFLLSLNTPPYTDVSTRPGKNFAPYNTGLVYGWYKSPPTLQTTANNRLQISQEWEFGLWPTMVYGTAL